MTRNRYSVIAANKKLMHFTLLFIAESKYCSDWVSMLHTHPFTEVFYVIKGEGSFITNQHQVEVRENDVVIVNANVEHTEISSDKNPLEYIAIGIQGISFTNLSKIDGPFIFHNFQDKQNEILFYLNAIVEEAYKKSPNYESACHHFLEILIIKLMRQLKLKTEQVNPTKLSKEIALAKEYINHHYKENITLDMLADLTHLNKFYLSHSFKQEVERTPIDYLNLRRIEEGKILLKTTNFSISQIANIVGYTSQSYFSEVFKKYELASPTHYRNINP